MVFQASNFIAPYNSTSKILRFKYKDGSSAFLINVCNYQHSTISKNKIILSLEDSAREYELLFQTETDAKTGILLLQQAIDTLKVNCKEQIVITGNVLTPIPLTYIQYKALALSSGLTPFQWYDVTDTTGLIIGTGFILRVQPLTNNDTSPQGIILGVNIFIKFECEGDKVVMFQNTKQDVVISNVDNLPYIDPVSSRDILFDNSTGQIVNGVKVSVFNSTVDLNNVTDINIKNSNVKLTNSSSVIIENVEEDLTGYSFNEVKLSPETNGKQGLVKHTITSNSIIDLVPYIDKISNEFLFELDDLSVDVNLLSGPLTLNSVFSFKLLTEPGKNGVNNIIRIKDNGNIIFTITRIQNNITYYVKKNLETQRWEVEIRDYEPVIFIPTLIDNQTVISLPIRPLQPNKLEFHLLGQKLALSLDYTYNYSDNTIIFLEAYNYQLKASDYVEIFII